MWSGIITHKLLAAVVFLFVSLACLTQRIIIAYSKNRWASVFSLFSSKQRCQGIFMSDRTKNGKKFAWNLWFRIPDTFISNINLLQSSQVVDQVYLNSRIETAYDSLVLQEILHKTYAAACLKWNFYHVYLRMLWWWWRSYDSFSLSFIFRV